jgi:nucleoside-diphosphate-sugar epimerase
MATNKRRGSQGQRVLVVGGAGYIGSVLVRDLLADGHRVRVLDSLVFGDGSIRELYHHPGFELIVGDFRHVGPVVRATRDADTVIHLGGIVGDPACAVDEDATLETNLAATQLLADVCRNNGVKRLVFASSCSVYGAAPDGTVDEESALRPVSLYAATKADSEKVLLAAQSRDFTPVMLRLSTAFGWSYRPRFDLLVNLLTAKALVEKKIIIYNQHQWRPFIHLKDISRAFRMAAAAPAGLVGGEIFNVGDDSMNYTLRELAERIGACEPGLKVEYVDNTDLRSYRVSFDKIRTRLGFRCATSLDEGVRGLRQALLGGLVADYRQPVYSNVQFLQMGGQRKSRANGKVVLTALQFAQNSTWRRLVDEAGDSEVLLRAHSNGLREMALHHHRAAVRV